MSYPYGYLAAAAASVDSDEEESPHVAAFNTIAATRMRRGSLEPPMQTHDDGFGSSNSSVQSSPVAADRVYVVAPDTRMTTLSHILCRCAVYACMFLPVSAHDDVPVRVNRTSNCARLSVSVQSLRLHASLPTRGCLLVLLASPHTLTISLGLPHRPYGVQFAVTPHSHSSQPATRSSQNRVPQTHNRFPLT